MIKRELEKDPRMKNEDWSRFLPNLRTDRSNRGKNETPQSEKSASTDPAAPEKSDSTEPLKPKKTKKESKTYTPFPPENHFTESKVRIRSKY